jgi:hypothetical protein
MKFTIEVTKENGLQVSTTIPLAILQVLIPLLAGGLAWPWLLELAQVLGLM